MKTYTVHCEWDDGAWVVTVPAIPGAITQSRRLDQVERDIGEAIELMTGESPGSYHIELDYQVPGEANSVAHEALRARREVERLVDYRDAKTAQAVRELRAAGFTYRDIGGMVGISYQRVDQMSGH